MGDGLPGLNKRRRLWTSWRGRGGRRRSKGRSGKLPNQEGKLLPPDPSHWRRFQPARALARWQLWSARATLCKSPDRSSSAESPDALPHPPPEQQQRISLFAIGTCSASGVPGQILLFSTYGRYSGPAFNTQAEADTPCIGFEIRSGNHGINFTEDICTKAYKRAFLHSSLGLPSYILLREAHKFFLEKIKSGLVEVHYL